jgi:hypothetical protein
LLVPLALAGVGYASLRVLLRPELLDGAAGEAAALVRIRVKLPAITVLMVHAAYLTGEQSVARTRRTTPPCPDDA